MQSGGISCSNGRDIINSTNFLTALSIWSANVFTKDLEEVITESSSTDEVHRCDDDSDHITEFFRKCLDRKGVAMEHTVCHNGVGALRFRQCNETGSL